MRHNIRSQSCNMYDDHFAPESNILGEGEPQEDTSVAQYSYEDEEDDGDRLDDEDYGDDENCLDGDEEDNGAEGDDRIQRASVSSGGGCRRICPKVDDYDVLLKDVIQEAIGHFRCQVVTSRPFPSSTRSEARLLAQGSWAAACQMFETDITWDSNIAKLIMSRASHVRGELKTKARSLVESMYGFSSGKSQKIIQRNRKRAEDLLNDYNYLYRRQTPEGRKGFCQHKITQKIVNAMWFRDAEDEGIKYDRYFLMASHRMLALIFTVIECCIEEWSTGIRRKINFTAQKFKPAFKRIFEMLIDFEKQGGGEVLTAVRTSLLENGRFHAGATTEAEDQRDPMSADAIAAAIQDFNEHGGLYEGSSSEEEPEDAEE
ncbi:hypothetical protein NEOLEDRAFT_1123044 [Neolentinus lepideus HHB14362 ss-1]|uniref:DUF6532 domain-containing protein n=1 Tax=Neolentinus lepideus HHB14362 ss-1 TaxID=1314782 RepID=A0A165NWG8_9AGAM|nr:hypothetical protein NEOLEDRAFT_1123044 [Neolentinus lepideus HHB14362 ss-1]